MRLDHVSRAFWHSFPVNSSFEPLSGAATGGGGKLETVARLRLLEHELRERVPNWRGSASKLLGAGLLFELQRRFFDHFCFSRNWPRFEAVLSDAGPATQAALLSRELPDEYRLRPAAPGLPAELSRLFSVREAVLLGVGQENPALAFLREAMSSPLDHEPEYLAALDGLSAALDRLGPVEGRDCTLMELLRLPAKLYPDSLEQQLAYLLHLVRAVVGTELDAMFGLAEALEQEETAARFDGPFDGPVPSPVFDRGEPERFSPDAHWMPNVVMIAKSIYVWLFQLGRKYSRPMNTLADIPDEELSQLSSWGFSSLWLIGVWERSQASKNIKQLCGNNEAIASAYSLKEYRIADGLGGEAGLANLKERAARFGIRIAADMVPNHCAIDSTWLTYHPERFLQLQRPPYPCYRFDGPELSWHPDVSVKIEDGYWNRRDAAVVFRRMDRSSGECRYIYHGNDGTSTPWNDTAQLDFTREDTREAVIQEIISVARRFSIIRFDAAMTLTRKHYQRLWFPAPGDGGAIPSRAEHGLDKEAFEQVFPYEFWRKVVDRIAAEVPDTLLLAEAFWLMEGYFVRTLGMHRVYNSAFMNMLKNEENAKYRTLIRDVLDFSPEILQRFVNFMNNPDEKTAVEQFGKGDKYFGIAMLMVTLPGLPMFGHGQIQGFSEKYGMEYARSYWNESEDQELIRRHEAEIFPLLKKRRIFSGVKSFVLYDFERRDGSTDEDVFAYSNAADGEHALVLVNNRYQSTEGRVRTSHLLAEKTTPSLSLAEALGLPADGQHVLLCREHVSGGFLVFDCARLRDEGLYFRLPGYGRICLLDFGLRHGREWEVLAAERHGQPIYDLEKELREIRLRPFRASMTVWLKELASAVPEEADASLSAVLDLLPGGFSLARPEADFVSRTLAVAGQLKNLRTRQHRLLLQTLVVRRLSSGDTGTSLFGEILGAELMAELAKGKRRPGLDLGPELLTALEALPAPAELVAARGTAEFAAAWNATAIRPLLSVHEADGHTWFIKEHFEDLLVLKTGCVLDDAPQTEVEAPELSERELSALELLKEAAEEAGYDFEVFCKVREEI